MKKTLVVIGIVIFGIISLALVKDQFLRFAVSRATTAVTGAPTKIRVFSLSLIKQSLHIKDFKMYNPKGFPKTVFVDIPEVEVDLDVGALLKGKLHLEKITLDLNEMVIVKNKEGQLNVDALKVSQAGQAEEKPKPGEKKPAAAQKTKPLPMQIDEVNLNLGRVIFKDYTKGEPPKVDVYELGIKNQQYKNITSAQQLAFLIMSEPLKHTAIEGAKIFAAQAVLGVGFLPAGVAITLAGKDSTQENYDVPYDKVYDTVLATLKGMTDRAAIKKENKETGVITALVDKNDVAFKFEKVAAGKTQMTVSARRLLLPKPEVAQGLAYQISQKLK
ncbi:MAG: AsmA family protein [Deltaproteobacteria bacterium]